MRKLSRFIRSFVLSSGLVLGLAAGPAAGETADQPVFRSPEGLSWAPLDPARPQIRAEVAVLAGDPSKPGPFAVRVRSPAGAEVPAHSHPAAEFVTVLSGTVRLSLGPEADRGAARVLGPGGFVYLPANQVHTFWVDADAVVDVFSTGPFAITYHGRQ